VIEGVAAGEIVIHDLAEWIGQRLKERPGEVDRGPGGGRPVAVPLLVGLVQTVCQRTTRTSAARSPDRAVRNGTRRTRRHEPTGLITHRSLVQIQSAQQSESAGGRPKGGLLRRGGGSFLCPLSARLAAIIAGGSQEPGQAREIVISVT
jgi:hypothetical protein